jgi:hypothetical protein
MSGCYADICISKNTAPFSWIQPFYHDYSPFYMETALYPWLQCSYYAQRVAVKKFVELVANGRLLECHAILQFIRPALLRADGDSMKSYTASPTMTFFSAALCARDLTNKPKFLEGISLELLHRVDAGVW